MELMLVGFNVLMIMAVWRFMLRPTILDTTRDRLFDMRASLRSEFRRNGWDLGGRTYRHLRDLTNGHLRFTEEVNLVRMSLIKVSVEESVELQEYVRERNAWFFDPANEHMARWVMSYRQRGNAIAMNWAVTSSGLLLLFALLLTPFVVVGEVVRRLRDQVNVTAKAGLRFLRNGRHHFGNGLNASVHMVAERLVKAELIESWSLQRGSARPFDRLRLR